MLCVNVELKERRYPIYIGEGLLKDETCYPLKKGDKVMLVTNPTVAQYYLEPVTETLEKIGCQVESVLLPDGEKYKTLESLNPIFTALLKHNHGRDTTIIALGGGVIGDVAGVCGCKLSAWCAFHSNSYYIIGSSGFFCWWQNCR